MWNKVPCPRIQHDCRDQAYSDLSCCDELIKKVNGIFLLLTKNAFPSDLLVFQLEINRSFNFRVPFASVSKRVQVRNLSHVNQCYSQVHSNSFSYERFCTWAYFENEAEGNSEMANSGAIYLLED